MARFETREVSGFENFCAFHRSINLCSAETDIISVFNFIKRLPPVSEMTILGGFHVKFANPILAAAILMLSVEIWSPQPLEARFKSEWIPPSSPSHSVVLSPLDKCIVRVSIGHSSRSTTIGSFHRHRQQNHHCLESESKKEARRCYRYPAPAFGDVVVRGFESGQEQYHRHSNKRGGDDNDDHRIKKPQWYAYGLSYILSK